MTDPTVLIQRWQSGDERAAEALYYQQRESIFRLAYSLLGSSADAEEVAQDTLHYALTHITMFDANRASFKTWLHVITVSRCRDRQRRRFLPLLSLARWLQRGGDVPASTPTPERQVEQSETSGEVWQAVQALKPKYREAIVLRYWAGHTYQEMANILNCPLRTAQSRVRLAYKQLRARLAPAAFQAINDKQAQ